ncbi:MAG: hypothetical protein LBP93_07260 [Treponema sp.]|jgi:hypothetical protein|nr:hypothetical protein [Treponema sp.]
MHNRADFFLTMFRSEMESSLEDVEYLASSYEKKFRRNEITNYVYNENESFLALEISELKKILLFIDSIQTESCKTAEEMAAVTEALLNKRLEEFDDPDAVYGIIKRKIGKVLDYLIKRPEDDPGN